MFGLDSKILVSYVAEITFSGKGALKPTSLFSTDTR